jgi:hypothetical protein
MATAGFVHIVESPSPRDLLDGQTEGRQLWETMNLQKIRCSYSLAVNQEMFLQSLNERLRRAQQMFEVAPILHLSMHGNKNGIELTDGEFIDWDGLRALIKPICEAWQHGLLICMSTCQGIYARAIAMYEEDKTPAFWAIVGSPESVSWSDSALAFGTFYAHFFRGTPIDECVRRMRIASGHEGFHFELGAAAQKTWRDWIAKQDLVMQAVARKRLEEASNAAVQRFPAVGGLLDMPS